MTAIRMLLATATTILLGAGAAQATEPALVVAPVPATAVVPTSPAAFNWGGFYIGAGISSASFEVGLPYPEVEMHLTAYAGYNFLVGTSLVAGAEIYISRATIPPDTYAFRRIGAEARVGYLIGPDILGYGSLGLARYEAGNTYITFGGGVEIAFGPRLSIDLAYDRERGFGPAEGNIGNRLTASLNFHFGR